MITRVEPSGVIFKDICEIQTYRCVAKEQPAPITAVWSLPGRKQINVCSPCLEQMIRWGEWEVKDARLKHRADIAVFDQAGKVKLIAEVKVSSLRQNSANQASDIRKNLLAHSGLPPIPFLLIAFPEHFYLWKDPSLDRSDRPADYQFDAKDIVMRYAEKNSISLQNMSPLDLEILVSQWLQDLAKSDSSAESRSWATQSGLYDAIHNGSVSMQVVLR